MGWLERGRDRSRGSDERCKGGGTRGETSRYYHSNRCLYPTTTYFWFSYITVKSHFKALGLYNFKRGFGWAYKRGGGAISGWAYKRNKKNDSERRDKTYLRNKLKLKFHYILSYIYNQFIVRHKATCSCL